MPIKRMTIEVAVVLVLAGVVGVCANAIHPDGIILSRNYFKLGSGGTPAPAPPVDINRPASSDTPPDTLPTTAAGPSNDVTTGSDEECIQQDEHGLTLACFEFVFGAWSGMSAGDESIVFVDARTEEAYAEEHIAGALLVDHYRLDRYLAPVKARLQSASIIVVYCSGDCEDSRYLATALIYDHHIAKEVIFLYEGGITDWTAQGQPVAQGMKP